MRSYFIGHGSPMNAVLDNAYADFLGALGRRIAAPKCVVVFSAHWLTHGTFITGAAAPEQIYDFYGFPPELYAVKYAPPGRPSVAEALSRAVPAVRVDPARGIDHAAWAVLRRMLPEPAIPVLEISMDLDRSPAEHLELARAIRAADLEDVLFIGSGNAVHNLREVDFDEGARPYPWAVECDGWIKGRIGADDPESLVDAKRLMPGYRRAAPTDDHFLPLIYTLGMGTGSMRIEYDEIQNGSVSMLSVSVE